MLTQSTQPTGVRLFNLEKNLFDYPFYGEVKGETYFHLSRLRCLPVHVGLGVTVSSSFPSLFVFMWCEIKR